MPQAQNIANAQTRQLAGSSHPSPSRGIPIAIGIGGGLGVILLLLLSALPRYAHAQTVNTGAEPYINSWHTYRIVVGNTGNTFEWDMVDVAATDTTHLDGSETWCDIAALDGDTLDISIFFTSSVFASGTEYGLLFREISVASGLCTAARRFTINPVDNELYYTLAADDIICKPQDSLVCSWDTTDVETYATTITYRVTLNKVENLVLTGWSFDARITRDPLLTHSFTSYTAQVVPVSEGTTVLTDGGAFAPLNDGWFHVAMSQILQTPDTTELSVDIVVTLSGVLHNGVNATLALENGQATSGVTGIITTYDNIAVPVGSDREQLITINALPDTRDIEPGSGETAWSTGSPVQYSTHAYAIEMGSMANLATSGWFIDTLNGGTVPFLPANYELSRTQSATNDTATITFNMGPGNYVLYFYETSADGCTALREYPFTLGDPFDVDIADVANNCPDIDDQFTTWDSVSVTTVDYVVTLESASYAAGWGFDFALSCDLSFTDITLDGSADISIVDIIGAGMVTYIPNADDTTGTVSVAYNATPTTQFTIRVNFHSQHYDPFEITAAMSNITGTYGERDENTELGTEDDDTVGTDGDTDGSDQNNTVHYIYKLPRTLALEGVD